ncbi:DUF4249 family protein [Flagellimonas sp.]|uniref:DUF4249 family protein n=1 Tax=Flagellimonas sp. TaxID=2058762 RepID=UPI003B5986D8
MKTLRRLLIVLVFFAHLACTKEIDPQTKFEPQIFIFGGISNEPDNVTIGIQETVPVKNVTVKPVSNASISLFTKDQTGTTELVTDSFVENNGIYTSAAVVSANVGNFYWIEVEVPGHANFKSEAEQLRPTVPITKVEMDNNMTRVSFKDPGDATNLYYLAFDFFNGPDFLFNLFEVSSDTLFDGNEEAFIETDNVGGNRIKATLYNLNYGTFQFYLNLIAQDDSNSSDEEGDPGHLFATPPVNLTGNIVNTSTKRAALGNFAVVSASSLDQSF